MSTIPATTALATPGARKGPRPLDPKTQVLAPAVAGDVLVIARQTPTTIANAAKQQLEAAKKANWRQFAAGGLLSLVGLGINAVGTMGAGTLPYAAFAGLFLGGLGVIGAGIYVAYKATEKLRALK